MMIFLSFVSLDKTSNILIGYSDTEDNRGRRGGRSYGSDFAVIFHPTDLFW